MSAQIIKTSVQTKLQKSYIDNLGYAYCVECSENKKGIQVMTHVEEKDVCDVCSKQIMNSFRIELLIDCIEYTPCKIF